MFDFFMDHFIAFMVGILMLLIGIVFYAAWYESVNCLSGHQEARYHPPTYMMVGKILMPVGGGTWDDFVCDKWK